jgi:hypothetical protein
VLVCIRGGGEWDILGHVLLKSQRQWLPGQKEPHWLAPPHSYGIGGHENRDGVSIDNIPISSSNERSKNPW